MSGAGEAPDISMRRATALMAVCHAWFVLGREVARYQAVVKNEDEETASVGDLFYADPR